MKGSLHLSYFLDCHQLPAGAQVRLLEWCPQRLSGSRVVWVVEVACPVRHIRAGGIHGDGSDLVEIEEPYFTDVP